ncbi:FAD-dependent oxidoreductase [Nocardia carnea]|uniref:FAD-dependent oxidoreductase n=1 Tax=Nocardia carnea TaxID=37328 RepID=UPI0024558612|nr:FAD-dependent oxidoreductase [Nocardia carnea]
MNDSRRYIVIGGGLAGLASAVWLAEAGKQVTLLERRAGSADAMEALIGGTGVIDEVFDRQRMHRRTPDGSWLYCLTTSGAYEQIRKSNEEIVTEQLVLIRRYYPEANAAKPVHAQVVNMPKATFSQVVGTAGLRPDLRTSVPNLMLAGDWTRTDWSATMESAAQSAERAVQALLAYTAHEGRDTMQRRL